LPPSDTEQETEQAASRDPSGDEAPFVYVLGTPGSGAAAVSDALCRMGLQALPGSSGGSSRARRKPAAAASELNRAVLACLGGTWSSPPPLPASWQRDTSLAALRARAASVARGWSGNRPMQWFDPLNCLLLGFWREVTERPSGAVLVYRDPATTPFDEWSELGGAHALALWERYHREALASTEGLPLMVVEYDEALSEPQDCARQVAQLVASLGASPMQPDGLEEAARAMVHRSGAAPPETQQEAQAEPRRELLASQRRVFEALRCHRGLTSVRQPQDPGPEGAWVGALLDATRRAERAAGDAARLDHALGWALDRVEELVPPATEGEPEPAPSNAARDRDRYDDWLDRRAAESGPPAPPGSRAVDGGVTITVVVPVFRSRPRNLERCIRSVEAQTYPAWELCLCDDASGDLQLTMLLEDAAARDSRIRVATLERNSGISAATNEAVSLGTGAFVAFLDHDDELHPDALARVAQAIAASPDADVVYSDEDKLDDRDRRCEPSFKPAWSPDWLLSTAYMCHLLVVRRSLLDEVGGLHSEFDGSQDYDLMLRATERARSVVHVPEILYHWRMVAGSAAEDTEAKPWAHDASRRAVDSALRRRQEQGSVEPGPYAGIYHVRRALRATPLVSVVVPFRDGAAALRRCLDSIEDLGGYGEVQVLLVDNDSEEPEVGALLDQVVEPPRVELLESPGPFNWSRINNEAVARSDGEVVLFLNNDVEGISEGWLRAMLEHAQRPGVAAVGARLVYPDGRLQHAGIVVGLFGKTGHLLQGTPHYDPGYMGMAKLTRNCSAVTGACMMTPRSVFDELGGFEESMAVGYSDIDYCLRARDAGYSILYTPIAELLHTESSTRGLHDDSAELALFMQRWGEMVETGDPYFNPNLSRSSPYCELPVENEEREWYAR
jgi:GT2 family glycosyltransferase